MKNFVFLALFLFSGIIVSTSIFAQDTNIEAPPSVESLIHQEETETTAASFSQSCEDCTNSMTSMTLRTPVKFVQRVVCSSPARRIYQTPSRLTRWVKNNKPIRSTIRNAACRLRCR